MARKRDKEKAIRLRLQGKSYSEIKQKLDVSKSTLSNWLHDYPLSSARIKALRDNNPRRIENFRNTMRRKREKKLQDAYMKVKEDISGMKKRELFVAGFFLYWAEGVKTQRSEVSLSNTDPHMLKFFIKWLEMLGVPRKELKARLHLYSDMDVNKQTRFWSRELGIPTNHFRKPYIKESSLKDIKYKGGFGQGTCNIIFGNQIMSDYILMGIKYIKDEYC